MVMTQTEKEMETR